MEGIEGMWSGLWAGSGWRARPGSRREAQAEGKTGWAAGRRADRGVATLRRRGPRAGDKVSGPEAGYIATNVGRRRVPRRGKAEKRGRGGREGRRNVRACRVEVHVFGSMRYEVRGPGGPECRQAGRYVRRGARPKQGLADCSVAGGRGKVPLAGRVPGYLGSGS